MRVQIHYNELRPLIKEGYEKVYDAMSRLLAPEEMIFAKWEAGFGGILQWTLPNDYTWRNFTQGDNYDKQAVINEFMRLKAIGEKNSAPTSGSSRPSTPSRRRQACIIPSHPTASIT